jgi:5-methylcytosine-specific restriction endonuclease McrA
VLERDDHRCRWCGGLATEADHLVAKVLGGTDDLDNLVAACRPCNAKRGQAVQTRMRHADRLGLSAAARHALGLSTDR